MFEKRIIGIDYGRKRIGIAYSDPLRLTAQPLTTLVLKSPQEAAERVRAVLVEHDVELVIIGLPMSLNGGSGGQMATEVRLFARRIEEYGYRVQLEDERFTSSQARDAMRSGGKSEKQMRGKLDTIAAQLILQDYLNAHHNK
jgi:putative Holliday junction resolvase